MILDRVTQEAALQIDAARLGEAATTGIALATVTGVASSTRVTVSRGAAATPRPATIAVFGGYAARAGDVVLTAETDAADLYVIGVVTALRAVTDDADPGRAPSRVEGPAPSSVEGPVVIRDRAGRAVLEHDPERGKTVLHAPEGDLELRADHGSVTVVARDDVKLHGKRRLDLSGATLGASAARVEALVGDVRVVGKSLRTAFETARHATGILEVQARRIVERAKATYRDAEDLAQTRAGRVRTVVETTFHVLAGTAIVKAEEDVKLKGKKIHLA